MLLINITKTIHWLQNQHIYNLGTIDEKPYVIIIPENNVYTKENITNFLCFLLNILKKNKEKNVGKENIAIKIGAQLLYNSSI